MRAHCHRQVVSRNLRIPVWQARKKHPHYNCCSHQSAHQQIAARAQHDTRVLPSLSINSLSLSSIFFLSASVHTFSNSEVSSVNAEGCSEKWNTYHLRKCILRAQLFSNPSSGCFVHVWHAAPALPGLPPNGVVMTAVLKRKAKSHVNPLCSNIQPIFGMREGNETVF